MRNDISNALEAKVSYLTLGGELYVAHGDGDLLAVSMAMNIEQLETPEQVRSAVQVEMYERAEAGLVSDPGVWPGLAEAAIGVMFNAATSGNQK